MRNATGVFNAPTLGPRFDALMDILEQEFSHLETYAREDLLPDTQSDFDTEFNSFMVFLGKMRAQGEFEDLALDRRNNASAFIWQIKCLATELLRIKQGVNALRNS